MKKEACTVDAFIAHNTWSLTGNIEKVHVSGAKMVTRRLPLTLGSLSGVPAHLHVVCV
jgi:hypothetical protein